VLKKNVLLYPTTTLNTAVSYIIMSYNLQCTGSWLYYTTISKQRGKAWPTFAFVFASSCNFNDSSNNNYSWCFEGEQLPWWWISKALHAMHHIYFFFTSLPCTLVQSSIVAKCFTNWWSFPQSYIVAVHHHYFENMHNFTALLITAGGSSSRSVYVNNIKLR